MSTADFDVIAERNLLLRDDITGQSRTITAKIGRPYWAEDRSRALCPISITEILEPRFELQGIDLLHALEMALIFADSFLSGPKARKFVWPSGEEYKSLLKIALDEWYPSQGSPRQGGAGPE
jgi:hypothetical protein